MATLLSFFLSFYSFIPTVNVVKNSNAKSAEPVSLYEAL